MKRGTYLSNYLQPLNNNPIQAFLTDKLQVVDIIEWCLEQLGGQCTIYQTTFSISEEYLRRIYFLKKRLANEGNTSIEKVVVLLDRKATHKTIRLWNFMARTFDKVYLSNNHSKTILMENESNHRVAIVTSQNLTRGNRQESSVITTDPRVYATLKQEILDTIQEHSLDLNQIMESNELYSHHNCEDDAGASRAG